MMGQLFFNKKDREYLFVCFDGELDLKCFKCHKVIEIGSYFFIHRSFSKTKFNKYNYCPACINYHKKRIYDDFITARFTNVCPYNSILIKDYPPSLKNCSASTFEMALNNKGCNSICKNVEIIDHTKLANNPKNGIMIEHEKAKRDMIILETENENKNLDPKKYLKKITEATPLIDGNKNLVVKIG